jgi:transcriptional regulator with XRE-family HTH domain
MMSTILLIVGERTAPEFVVRVGQRVRSMRRERGWTVQQLADAADVSRRMLTQIELGQANPSLVTIDRVAGALGTDFAALALADPTTAASAFGVAPTPVWRDDRGSEAVLLAATLPPRAELWKWTLAPGARYDAQPDRAGTQEIHHVVAGELTVETSDGTSPLTAGETAVIRSDQRYAYRNAGPVSAVFFRVVSGA